MKKNLLILGLICSYNNFAASNPGDMFKINSFDCRIKNSNDPMKYSEYLNFVYVNSSITINPDFRSAYECELFVLDFRERGKVLTRSLISGTHIISKKFDLSYRGLDERPKELVIKCDDKYNDSITEIQRLSFTYSNCFIDPDVKLDN